VGDGEERQSLAASARRLRIEDRVLFRGFSSSPAEFYQGFDVFILPSRFEGLPFSLVEAMASGCEVLATRVGGIPEVITSQAFGTLVPPSDVEALARAMSERLVASAAERAAISRAAREHVMAHFSQRESCRQTMSVLLGEPA
jgi:glycosyltransferase involved in cell wall biosynthesis